MGKYIDDKRDYVISVRFKQDEKDQILAEMTSINCLSISKFVRMKTLDSPINIQRTSSSLNTIVKQINLISKQIAKIGTNYNQVVKKYNASCGAKKKNGDPVINSLATKYYIEKLINFTMAIKKEQDAIIEAVNRIVVESE